MCVAVGDKQDSPPQMKAKGVARDRKRSRKSGCQISEMGKGLIPGRGRTQVLLATENQPPLFPTHNQGYN